MQEACLKVYFYINRFSYQEMLCKNVVAKPCKSRSAWSNAIRQKSTIPGDTEAHRAKNKLQWKRMKKKQKQNVSTAWSEEKFSKKEKHMFAHLWILYHFVFVAVLRLHLCAIRFCKQFNVSHSCLSLLLSFFFFYSFHLHFAFSVCDCVYLAVP